MSRNDWIVGVGFLLLLAGVTGAVYGNPFALEGTKYQEFLGYIVGVVFSAAILTAVASFALLRVDKGSSQTPTATQAPNDARVPSEQH